MISQYLGEALSVERDSWRDLLEEMPEHLTAESKERWIAGLSSVCLSSDAYFPFRDSIDHAHTMGVGYVAQPGGSLRDREVVEACDEYGMVMVFTSLRLFQH